MSSRLRIFPFLRDGNNPLYPFQTNIQHVHSQMDTCSQHDATRSRYGHEYCRDESVITDLDYYLLPNHESTPDPYRGCDQLFFLQEEYTAISGLQFDSYVLRRSCHQLLRRQTTATSRDPD